MNLLEYIAVGLFYLPFLFIPFALLFWYAFASNREKEKRDARASLKEDDTDESGR